MREDARIAIINIAILSAVQIKSVYGRGITGSKFVLKVSSHLLARISA